jgi:hypothetical protein
VTPLFKGISALIIAAAVPAAASADPIPRKAKAVPAERVLKAYSGKTDSWDDGCSGGIYYSPNGQVRAWCAENAENFAAGTWSVDANGTLCHQLTWYWRADGRTGSSDGGETCIEHVREGGNRIYRSWPGDSEWWVMDKWSEPSRGYEFREQVEKAQAALGM